MPVLSVELMRSRVFSLTLVSVTATWAARLGQTQEDERGLEESPLSPAWVTDHKPSTRSPVLREAGTVTVFRQSAGCWVAQP